jgi:SAM-dependent methyltransferase
VVQLGWRRTIVAIARNQLHRFLGGAIRGGHRTREWPEEQQHAHAAGIYQAIVPYLGPLSESVGLEIGPGDNLDVCQRFLVAGCRRVYAVEKYARPTAPADGRVVVLRAEIEDAGLPEPVDFAYSNDVFEHVRDVPGTMTAVFETLRPGGRFVSSVDLRGHNAFSNPRRPLDFLTCPDWLWGLMFSHIVTTNRVRVQEFVDAAKAAGFRVLEARATATADRAYLQALRPHLLPRYRQLPDDDLLTLQLLLVLEKPSVAPPS